MQIEQDSAELRLRRLVSAPVLCFSHLRWNFVYQRPQHLLSRCAQDRRVFFFEEPLFEDVADAALQRTITEQNVFVATPVLPRGTTPGQAIILQRRLLDELILSERIGEFISWYYTPMALPFTKGLAPLITVYDCMDELAAFRGAPPEMVAYELELFANADVVFTGGHSLFLAKRKQHDNVHLFASSVDVHHFARARRGGIDPTDQASIPRPRAGFFGVLDERLDRELLAQTAARLPEWHLILIGPAVKIRENELPRADNIHYLGAKSYHELPDYIAHWDVAMLPFAINESTRFISPTKTPEYLSAGRPVISTPVPDVVSSYGQKKLVHIAANAPEFAAAIACALDQRTEEWRDRVDAALRDESWDVVWQRMWRRIEETADVVVAPRKSGVTHLTARFKNSETESAHV